MRRTFVIFLLLLLPLQFVWGAAAGYCQHEERAGVEHFGHHIHKHQSKVLNGFGDSSSDKMVTVGDDPDCTSCHLACVSPVNQRGEYIVSCSGEQIYAALDRELPSPPPGAIDRPNWTLIA
jgi:hypothetical protein